MTVLDGDPGRELRMSLARSLLDSGDLSAEWRSAVEMVPRHVLVPFFYRQDGTGKWCQISSEDPGFFAAVYSDTALTTQVTDGIPTSSSSQPSLMLHMLDALDVQDGNRVLEIATGAGYNAALLSERLGSDRVYTVEVDRELVRDARDRLVNCGYNPVVVTGDGRKGLTEGAPYDRLIATCGFTSVPPAWIQQVRPGGIIVCPLGRGNARLVVGHDERAEGRFLPGGSYFMGVRSEGGNGRIPYPGDPAEVTMRQTHVDYLDVEDDGMWFALSLVLPEIAWAHETGADGARTGCRLWACDGSWARVQDREVRQAGPRPLWNAVERAYGWWNSRGRPERERFGVTATESSTRWWLDSPGTPVPDMES
ncbi:methyltransferase domain-containing protein [Streptomyces sp. CB02959]|uniref:methyltransferase domain-containing protein n=1 Tax=Streptomyces sp. CB02959 TaxID=2020330 RepID=UPI00215243B4|nr:methyltransferase domain-containing protein [Streptomyces sp. CB02959]